MMQKILTIVGFPDCFILWHKGRDVAVPGVGHYGAYIILGAAAFALNDMVMAGANAAG